MMNIDSSAMPCAVTTLKISPGHLMKDSAVQELSLSEIIINGKHYSMVSGNPRFPRSFQCMHSMQHQLE